MRGLVACGVFVVVGACSDGMSDGAIRADAGDTDVDASEAVVSCADPVPVGTRCAAGSARCTGDCSNSWQAENECQGGTWEFARTVACGPNAQDAPQCRNSFSGGALSPCCPAGGL